MHMLICISTIMKTLRMHSRMPRDLQSHVFGIHFILQSHTSISWLRFLSLLIATSVDGSQSPLCRGAAYLTYLRLFPLPPTAHPCKWTHCARQRTALMTANQSVRGHSTVTFDTDGIPFIVDNSATCIITNERSLFVGTLMTVNVKVDTIEATQVRQRYEGTIRLDLVDDFNVSHSYDIP